MVQTKFYNNMVPLFNVTNTLQTKYVQTCKNEITSYFTASGQVVLGYINSDLKISLRISLEFCS